VPLLVEPARKLAELGQKALIAMAIMNGFQRNRLIGVEV